MGRGVDRLSRADGVTFFDVSSHGRDSGFGEFECPECEATERGYEEDCIVCNDCTDYGVAMNFTAGTEYDEDQGRDDWEDFKDNLVAAIQKKYPSLEDANGWEDETSIILENRFCEIGISEYIGYASLSIRAKESDGWYSDDNVLSLAGAWVDRTWPGMIKAIDKEMPWANRLEHMGTFSNGESVYQRVKIAA